MQNATASTARPEAQDDPVKRKGRPHKQRQEQKQTDTPEDALGHRRIAKKPAVPSQDVSRPIKGKGKAESTTDEPVSSQPRRSGRERQLRNPDEVNGTRRSNASQDTSSPTEPRRTRSKQVFESEPISSTSRRRGAGRDARDPDEALPVDEKETKDTQSPNMGASNEPVKGARDEANPLGADGKRRRLRPSSNAQENTQENPRPSRKTVERNNKPRTQNSVAGGTEVGPPVRRGRPKASAPSAQELDIGGPSESGLPLREEGSDIVKRPRKRKEALPKPRQNESSTEDESSGGSEEESDLPFRYLKEEIQNIPRSKVTSKWNRLDAPSINTVSAFLADAQRPVLFRLQNTNRRREHASAAMGDVSRRLRAKLIKGFPFPAPIMGAPSRAHSRGHEDEFDFERTVDTMQNLENTLNPLLHSISLLEKEIKKQEDALAKDYNSLHKLETNARSKTREWREKAKREHALAPGVKRRDRELHRELNDQLELVPPGDDKSCESIFTVRQDQYLNARQEWEPMLTQQL